MAQGIRITFYDAARHESRSLTVAARCGSTPTVAEVAQYVQDKVAAMWLTTKLNDRRHKRR